MTTKYEDASSIVGSTFAAKLAAYEEKLRKKEKYKSEALVLKAAHRNQAILKSVAASIQRTNQQTYSIAHGPGSWPRKVRGMQRSVQSFIDDLQRAGAWDPRIKAAVHRGVHRLKKQAEVAHTTQMVKSSIQDARMVEGMVNDLRMRKVLGLR